MVRLPFGELRCRSAGSRAGRRGAELLLGIRPHDLAPARAEPPRGPRFPATVHLTEPLGDVTVLDLDAGGTMLKMVLPEEDWRSRSDTATGLAVELSLADTHLFSGRRAWRSR